MTDFPKTLKYEISRKFVQWEPSCSMRTDGRKDRYDEANSRFFAIPRTRPKKKREGRPLKYYGTERWHKTLEYNV